MLALKKIFIFALTLSTTLTFFSCGSAVVEKQESNHEALLQQRIVSLNGTLTELLFEFGLGDAVVAVDVTSTFPEQVQRLPKVGHSRSFQAEGILMHNPDVIIGKAEEVSPELRKQLEGTGVRVLVLEQEYSKEGTANLIKTVATELNIEHKTETLLERLNQDFTRISALSNKPRAMFIYARGAGTLLVAGSNTQMHALIDLAGGKNCFEELEGFKPLTAEGLVKHNPEVVILFEKGMESLNGREALASVPGITQTDAFKNDNFIIIDGQLASGFGPRLGIAAAELNKAFSNLN